MMEYEWDEAKSEANRQKHGLSFDAIHDFDWNYALQIESQIAAQELRSVWIGPIGFFLFSIVVTERRNRTRIISMRRATKHEKHKWRDEFQ